MLHREDSEDQLDDSTGRPLNETRYLIRRAHLHADATWRFLAGSIEIDGSTVRDPLVRLFGAEVAARWPEEGAVPLVLLSIGLMRIPFGAENPQRDIDRLFLERSNMTRSLFPGGSDLGVRLGGGYRILRWQIAVMNGHPNGEQGYPLLDATEAKDGVGRLGIEATAASGRVRLRGGVSGLFGTGLHPGTPGTKDRVDWRDDNGDGVVQPSELHPILGVAATPAATFRRFALGADALVEIDVPRLGVLTLFGELLWAGNLDRALMPADPVSTGRDLRELGWFAGLTQEITRWAIVGVRYDRYDPDADAMVQQGAIAVPKDAGFSTLAVSAAVQAPPWGRLVLEYDHNTNALGIGPSGAPATLGSDAVTLRAQMAF